MASLADALTRPFTGAWRRLRRTRWITRIALFAFLVIGLPVLAAVVIYLLPARTAVALGQPLLAWLSDAPPLPANLDPVSERSVLLAADGSELATLFDDVNRVRVGLDDVPDVVVDALLASEDNSFYDHPGIDHRAVMRAAVANLRSGGISQGGSTLTQQLVKNVYLDPSQTVRRKLTEAWYALELEDRLTKDEILARYLNEAYFGQGSYGIEAASQLYFDKPAQALDVREAALLIGVLPSPSALNPVDDPDAAREARNRVLDRMVATDRLDGAEAERSKAAGLALNVTPPPPPAEPFFVAYISDLLTNDPAFDDALGTDPVRRERLIYGGGLTVHTTLVPRLQDAANATIDEVMGDPGTSPIATLVTVEPSTGAVQAMAVGPKSFGRCDKSVNECPRTMVNPTAPGLGGSGRQPGSAFKPFVLAAALDEEVPPGWEQRTDAGKAIGGCDDNGKPYRPGNYSEDPGVKDMAEAIRVSNNVYHAKLAGLLGPPRLVDAAEQAGLRNGVLPEQCSVALGSGSAYPLAMAAAYATFANNGSRCDPIAVTRIELGAVAGGGDVAYEPQCRRSFDAEVATQMNALLQEPVRAGTATAAQLDRPVAGKTGTTDDYKDAWFVGYVPQLATSAWIGYERPKVMNDILGVEQVTGGTIPAQLWQTYMRRAVRPLDPAEFDPPPDIEPVAVPRFVGQTVAELREEYEGDYTFNLEVVRTRNYRPPGTVARQRPEPQRTVAPGKLVTLFVSDGRGAPPRVPDVVGLRRQRARAVLVEAKYGVEVRSQTQPLDSTGPLPADDGTVVEMSPGAGTRLAPGRTVTITVREYERGTGGNAPGRGNGNGRGDGRGPEEDPSEDPGGPGPQPSPPPDPLPEPSDDPAPGKSRQVTLARIVADPAGDDLQYNRGEYVTVQSGRSPVDVSGWTIEYEGGGVLRIGDGYRMGPGATLDVHTGSGENEPPERYFNGLPEEVLRNDGGVLILRDERGREVDRREY